MAVKQAVTVILCEDMLTFINFVNIWPNQEKHPFLEIEVSISFFVNLSTWGKQSLLVFHEIHSQIHRNALQFFKSKTKKQCFCLTLLQRHSICCVAKYVFEPTPVCVFLPFAILVGLIHAHLTIPSFLKPRSYAVQNSAKPTCDWVTQCSDLMVMSLELLA